MHRTTRKLSSLLLGLPLLLSACAGNSPGNQTAPTTDATPHGYIAGAQENSEPQTGLLTFDRETGQSQLLSLLTEKTVDAGTFGAIDAVQQDGRYALVTTSDAVKVFDTGAWTVDHGDHMHYYSSEPRQVGNITVPDPGVVAGDGISLAVFSESGGYASIYEHKDLDSGVVVEAARITTTAHKGFVIPYEGHFVASIAGEGTAAGAVEVRDAKNNVVLGEQQCAGSLAHATTRVGVVLACKDGALLITEDDGKFEAEKIVYPADAAGIPPATRLAHRPGSNELAAFAGDGGVWHLNVSKRTWKYLKTPLPVVAASAVGDTKRVLALGVDGSLMTINPSSGEVTAQAAMLKPLSAQEGTIPQLYIDAARAYLSDPAGSTVREIDYADGLRVARTFNVPAADVVLETGL
ncbi:hypothetical protein [Arthrobacter sp. R4-81]